MKKLNSILFTKYRNESFSQKIRLFTIKSLIGLDDIDDAFENPLNLSEVELLFNFFIRKFDLSKGEEDPYLFILTEIGISENSLELIGANCKEYYYHISGRFGLYGKFHISNI